MARSCRSRVSAEFLCPLVFLPACGAAAGRKGVEFFRNVSHQLGRRWWIEVLFVHHYFVKLAGQNGSRAVNA